MSVDIVAPAAKRAREETPVMVYRFTYTSTEIDRWNGGVLYQPRSLVLWSDNQVTCDTSPRHGVWNMTDPNTLVCEFNFNAQGRLKTMRFLNVHQQQVWLSDSKPPWQIILVAVPIQ